MMAEVELYARRTHLILNFYSLNNLEESLSKAAAVVRTIEPGKANDGMV